MRRLVLVVLLTACSGGGSGPERTESAGGERVRPELHCTERPAGGESDCTARGCSWTAPLRCYGTPPPDVEAEWDRSDAASASTCTCVCPADVEACSRVPSAPPPS